ncbi:hypothetical protein [Chitinophaga sp. LS1]|uniref:hypothetical protein n=1 Tax=Chitinophaga sp. LS1 TaxID=3051176 RepID=UPI002AAC45ED|nr:hypothetical protein [Chitinophaga sp. LS1]WPV66690.1 hypothetical protein QQL36_33385 [Chitinophaga sp. LS1]
MKSLSLILSFILFLCFSCYSQEIDDVVCSYKINGTPVYGIKIKTNIPYGINISMPTLMIEGYDYQYTNPINLTLCWYINTAGDFTHYAVTSSGSFNPPITLANENGKISIFIDSKAYWIRFHVRVFAKGFPGETAANFGGWSVVDSTLIASATNPVIVPYKNSFVGNVYLPDSVTSTESGKFGIGTLLPRASLDVAGTSGDSLTSVLARLSGGNNTGKGTYIGIRSYSTALNSPAFGVVSSIAGVEGAKVLFMRHNNSTGQFLAFCSNDGTEKMRLDVNGNLCIGTTTAGNYKLAVEGTIGARKLQVTQTSWADFVFKPSYNLPSLSSIEKYISENQHLPGIPAESDVLAHGVDLGEMNRLLLQKVEEITLYLIEEHKSNERLKEENEELRKRVDKIMSLLEAKR